MDVLTTPPERFAGVPDLPYEPHYTDVGGLTMAHVETGDASTGETFLCLHGEPTWGFLYRTMMPVLGEAGRVVVPDMIGFGRSDKPVDEAAHTYDAHIAWYARFIEEHDLTDITLVCQDWGGLSGLYLASVELPDRFSRVVAMNTGLIDGTVPMPDEWQRFAGFVRGDPDVPVGRIMAAGIKGEPAEDVVNAYEAPFPDATYKAGARAMPDAVPQSPDQDGAEQMARARKALAAWDKPFFVLFGDSDPITRAARDDLRGLVPTAGDEPDVWVEGAGHFLQEDAGEDVARRIVEFAGRRPLD